MLLVIIITFCYSILCVLLHVWLSYCLFVLSHRSIRIHPYKRDTINTIFKGMTSRHSGVLVLFTFWSHAFCPVSRLTLRYRHRPSKMSLSRLFSIIVNSNVLQNMTTLNMASRESMKKAQVISCPPLPELGATLSEVRSESTVCIYAGLTGQLLCATEGNTIYATIDPILAQLRDHLFKLCSARPALQVVFP